MVRLLLSKYALCDSKKSRCNKEQEPNGLVTSLGIRTPLGIIPLLGNILF